MQRESVHLSLLRRNPPTPRPPGNRTPRGIARAACMATLATESSGTSTIRATAAAADAAAPPKKTAGGVLRATAAKGSRLGARSTPVAINGNTLSLDASRTPIRSLSSANISRLDAVVKVKPAFSRRVRRPS